jgi:hypothetical protein
VTYRGTAANAGSGMVLGPESNGGCSGYSAQHFGLSTSVDVQGAVVSHLTLFKIGGGLHVRFASVTRPWLLPRLFRRIQRRDGDTG